MELSFAAMQAGREDEHKNPSQAQQWHKKKEKNLFFI